MTKRSGIKWRSLDADESAMRVVTVASTDEVEAHGGLASEFMSAVFELEPGDYLITDESDLLGFVSFDQPEANQVWQRIERLFGVSRVEVGSGRLARILHAIAARGRVQ